MTSFPQSVFFLSTAQEEQNRFLGECQQFSPESVDPVITVWSPGIYRVEDGRLIFIGPEGDALQDPASPSEEVARCA
jgi:hypothetical protein